MQRVLVIGSVIILVLMIPFGILVAGDYYNFPLWPINYLNKIIPVNFQCQITDPYPIPLKRVSSGNNFIIVDIKDKKGNPVDFFHGELLKTDSNGLLRIYLPEGAYMVRAHIIGVKGERIVKFGTGEPNEYNKITFNRENNLVKLNLYQLKESDIRQMISRAKKYFSDGYIDQAYTLVQGLEKIEAHNAEDAKLKGEVIKIKEQLGNIKKLLNELASTQIDHYNSKIIIYQQILDALKQLLPDVDEKEIKIMVDDQAMFPLPMIKSLESTRNKIIENHIQNIKEFLAIGKYSKATAEWEYLRSNVQLITKSPYLSDSATPLLKKAKSIILEGRKQIHQYLSKIYKVAIQNYYKGDFEKSREKFNQVYEEYMALTGQFRIDEKLIQEVYVYIRDLMFIEKGYNDYMMNDTWQAVESFKSIKHWTTRLQEIMDEMRLPVKRSVQDFESNPTTTPITSPGR